MPRQPVPSETEKLTVNLTVVDLGQIDLLVEDGFYSNRADFIRTAIRSQMSQHADHVRGTTTRRTMATGIVHFSKQALEREKAQRRRLDIKVVGMFDLDKNVSPELAKATIKSLEVRGVFRASDAVKKALADRMR